MNDEEYWKQFLITESGGLNHNLSMDVIITLKDQEGFELHTFNERDINCNLNSLENFSKFLKDVIRMIDEREGFHGESLLGPDT